MSVISNVNVHQQKTLNRMINYIERNCLDSAYKFIIKDAQFTQDQKKKILDNINRQNPEELRQNIIACGSNQEKKYQILLPGDFITSVIHAISSLLINLTIITTQQPIELAALQEASIMPTLTSAQQNTLNRMIICIERRQVDSAVAIMMSANNGFSKDQQKQISERIKNNAQTIIQDIIGCANTMHGQWKKYEILFVSDRFPVTHEPDTSSQIAFGPVVDHSLLFSPENLKKEDHSRFNVAAQFFNGYAPNDILQLICSHLRTSENFLVLRLVNRHLSQADVNTLVLYKKLAIITRNIKTGHYKFDQFQDNDRNTWDFREIRDMHAHGGYLCSVGHYLFGKSLIRIWDLKHRSVLKTFLISEKKFLDYRYGIIGGFRMRMHKNFFYLSTKSINVWNVNRPISTYNNPLRRLNGHNDTINDLQIKEYLYTSSQDHTIKIWDQETGSPLRTIIDNRFVFNKILFGENRNYALTDKAIKSWDDRSPTTDIILQELPKNVDENFIHINDETFYTCNLSLRDRQFPRKDKFISIWDLRKSDTPFKKFAIAASDCRVEQIVIDKKYLFLNVSVDWDSSIKIFDCKSGELLHTLKETTVHQKLVGAKENIQTIQVHQGILYSCANYPGDNNIFEFYFGREKYTIKAWDFNLPPKDESCIIS